MSIIEIIIRLLYIATIVYALRVIYKRERILREPVKYMVTYIRYGNGISYGSCGVDVRGGIKSDELDEITAHVREKTGFPDAFIMGFSRYED